MSQIVRLTSVPRTERVAVPYSLLPLRGGPSVARSGRGGPRGDRGQPAALLPPADDAQSKPPTASAAAVAVQYARSTGRRQESREGENRMKWSEKEGQRKRNKDGREAARRQTGGVQSREPTRGHGGGGRGGGEQRRRRRGTCYRGRQHAPPHPRTQVGRRPVNCGRQGRRPRRPSVAAAVAPRAPPPRRDACAEARKSQP